MSNDVAIRQAGDIAELPGATIIRLAQSKAIIQHVMKAIMKGPTEQNPLGVHYGKIPGTPKNTLLKPGSEVILSTFRISVDAEVEDLSTDDYIRYRVKTIGRLPDGTIVGYGFGECSSDEEKYKWRKPKSAKEFEAVDPGRRRVKYESSYETNQVRTEPADVANTILKMAKKRSQIDLTLTATGASDVFDQDLEDLKDVIDITDYQKGGKPEVKTPQSTTGTNQGAAQGSTGTTAAQKYDLATKIKPGGVVIVKNALEKAGISEAAFCAHFKIATVEDLLSGDMTAGMNAIKKGEIQ